MDWKKTLNITAIGLVAWLLVVEWNNFSELRDAEQRTATVAAELLVPETSLPLNSRQLTAKNCLHW